LNYLFFDGGPLDGKRDATTTQPNGTVVSRDAVYKKERSWSFVKGTTVHCYRFAGPSSAGSAGARS
jgi:hypothetical protein